MDEELVSATSRALLTKVLIRHVDWFLEVGQDFKGLTFLVERRCHLILVVRGQLSRVVLEVILRTQILINHLVGVCSLDDALRESQMEALLFLLFLDLLIVEKKPLLRGGQADWLIEWQVVISVAKGSGFEFGA